MIPIDYLPKKLTEYDKFIAKFISELNDVIKKGYCENRVSIEVSSAKEMYNNLSRYKKITFDRSVDKANWKELPNETKIQAPKKEMILDPTTENFLKYAIERLQYWTTLKPDDIKKLAENIFETYPDFSNHNSTLYKCIYNLFVSNGYNKKIPKEVLIEASNADVCPYCNRIFIKNVEAEDGVKIKGHLDHFYDKSSHPFLALLKYNLVPCCPFCNGPTGKWEKDAIKEKLVNPLCQHSENDFKFKIEFTGKGLYDVNRLQDAFEIALDFNNPDMENNVRVFHLKELYQTHKDYAADIIVRKQKYNSSYLNFVNKIINIKEGINVSLTEDNIDRIILGFSKDPKELNKRPLSKFCLDILEDYEKNN